jgi:hypothetical protein
VIIMLNIIYRPDHAVIILHINGDPVEFTVIDRLPDEPLGAFSDRANCEALSWLSSTGHYVPAVSYDWSNAA